LFNPRNGEILGAQIIGGVGTEKRIDVLATAINYHGTVFDLENLELAYAPPYGSAKDPINMAGFVASNLLKGIAPIWHWHDLDAVYQKNGVLLDVRTKDEFDLGHFKDAINISDTDLREHIAELPKDRPIYINCQVGFRGYLASRLLMQSGFKDVYNLSGGYKTYEYAVMQPEAFKPIPYSPHATILEQTIGRPRDDIQGSKVLKFVDACGLSCPGPLNALIQAVQDTPLDNFIQIKATDPSFVASVKAYAELTEGIELISIKKEESAILATIYKNKDFKITASPLHEAMKPQIKENKRPIGLPIVSEISALELKNEFENSNPPAIVIDVREPHEWKRGHIPQAQHIPLGMLQSKTEELKKYQNQEIITVCHSGMRSLMAGQLLERAGFQWIRSLKGGMIAWARAKYPID
jgi:rhodanese-related sulfurtransferase/TusA-related sulfurtransferase